MASRTDSKAPDSRSDAASERRTRTLELAGLWASLSPGELGALARSMESLNFPSGEFVIRQGEQGERLHVVTEGMLEVRIRTSSGVVLPVAQLASGECFGEMSLLTGDDASADVVALEDTETLSLDRAAFNKILDDHPSLLRQFVNTVSRRLKATDEALTRGVDRELELTRFLAEDAHSTSSVLVGKDKAAKTLGKRVDKEAVRRDALLLRGERGVGKEAVARQIHFRSDRGEGPLLAVDCARIKETRWGDQLFGDFHRKDSKGGPRTVCFMDLSEGGTLLLKNIDLLPPAVIERLDRYLEREGIGGRRRDVRIVASYRDRDGAPEDLKDLLPGLPAPLDGNQLRIPPLRERKKDIAVLAEHFLERHIERVGSRVKGIDDQAMFRLITWDYRFGNVRELEDAIKRAVTIAAGEVIVVEEIFLAPPIVSSAVGVDLLRLPRPIVDMALKWHPKVTRAVVTVVFAGILFLCFFSPTTQMEHLALALVWGVWWPALILSFLLLGRAWCGICPMAYSGKIVQKLAQAKGRIPGWMKNRETLVASCGFFAVMWVEESTGMRHSPVATGLLILTILAGAVLTSLRFPRRTWCRHLCPMGGFASLCSTTALVELRPTADICNAKCTGHRCYSGTETSDGCPMFQHVMFVDTNQNCVLCLNCVRSCENHSPQLHVRLPLQELWRGVGATAAMGRMVAMFLGLIVALGLVHAWEHHEAAPFSEWVGGNRFLAVSAILPLVTLLPVGILWLAERLTAGAADGDGEHRPRTWALASAWLPVVVGGFAAYQVTFIPGLGILETGFAVGDDAESGQWLSSRVLPIVQGVLLGGGVLLSAVASWKGCQIASDDGGFRWRRLLGMTNIAGVVLGASALCAVLLGPPWIPAITPAVLLGVLTVLTAGYALSLRGGRT